MRTTVSGLLERSVQRLPPKVKRWIILNTILHVIMPRMSSEQREEFSEYLGLGTYMGETAYMIGASCKFSKYLKEEIAKLDIDNHSNIRTVTDSVANMIPECLLYAPLELVKYEIAKTFKFT